MLKNNYHTHLIFCNHAIGYSEDYVRKAIELNMDEIGITDHAPIPESFMTEEEYKDNWCSENMKYETLTTYLLDVHNAKDKYKDQIKVLIGFETEYLPWGLPLYQELRRMSDYLNVGIHYFYQDKKIINTYDGVNRDTLPYYVNNCIEAMKTGLFNTLVHPDLFMYSYTNIKGERKFDEYCVKATRNIIEAAIKYDVYLEINANGLRKTPIGKERSVEDWLYPWHEFWEIAKEYKNLKILIGADAHNPEHLASENIDIVMDFAKNLGLHIEEKMEINH